MLIAKEITGSEASFSVVTIKAKSCFKAVRIGATYDDPPKKVIFIAFIIAIIHGNKITLDILKNVFIIEITEMRIEIDGTPIKKPAYARSLAVGKFAEYVANADEYDPDDSWISGWGGHYMPRPDDAAELRMFEKVATDPDLPQYRIDIIKTGPYDKDTAVLGSAQSIGGQLADELVEKGEYLELVPTRKFKDAKAPGTVYKTDWTGEKSDTYPCVPHVFEGMIVFRGDVEQVTSHGGITFIDGDVNAVTQNHEGIIYVSGDVYNLIDTDKAIVVVGGKIRNFSQARRSGGGLRQNVTPSPYVFSAEQIQNKKEREFTHGEYGIPVIQIPIEIPPSAFVVQHELLRGWMPEEVKEKALELCKQRIESHFKGLLTKGLLDKNFVAGFIEIARGLTTAKEFAAFARNYIYKRTEDASRRAYDHASCTWEDD